MYGLLYITVCSKLSLTVIWDMKRTFEEHMAHRKDLSCTCIENESPKLVTKYIFQFLMNPSNASFPLSHYSSAKMHVRVNLFALPLTNSTQALHWLSSMGQLCESAASGRPVDWFPSYTSLHLEVSLGKILNPKLFLMNWSVCANVTKV